MTTFLMALLIRTPLTTRTSNLRRSQSPFLTEMPQTTLVPSAHVYFL